MNKLPKSTIDKQYLHNAIEFLNSENYVIPLGSVLDIGDIEKLSLCKKNKLQNLFEPFKNKKKDTVYVYIHFQCKRCNALSITECLKQDLLSHIEEIQNNRPGIFVCSRCYDIIQEEKKIKAEREKIEKEELKKIQKEQRRIEKINNTKYFINTLLKPNGKLPDFDFYYLQRRIYDIDNEFTTQYILNMPYKDFLSTPYWKIISYFVKKRAHFKCKMCSNNGELHVHHSTYEILGKELHDKNTDYLICLCKMCHQKFHNKGESK